MRGTDWSTSLDQGIQTGAGWGGFLQATRLLRGGAVASATRACCTSPPSQGTPKPSATPRPLKARTQPHLELSQLRHLFNNSDKTEVGQIFLIDESTY